VSEEKGKVQVVPAEGMREFCVAACRKVRLSAEHGGLVADALIQADLRGVESHGITRLPGYLRGFQSGGINPKPRVKVVKESGAVALVDGDNGLGLVVSRPSMSLAMDKASEYGIGAVTVRNSNHYGMAAYWSMMALERDMIGFTTTNASPTMAPWGGVALSLGNNPVSYAIPSGSELPIVLDIAMSVVAGGKIRMAALKNEPIPAGWAMNKHGQPTTDAQEAMGGLLMPVGAYKGYGLAVINDIFCGVLSGGQFGADIPKGIGIGGTSAMGYCHFFMALDIAHFMPVTEFKSRVDKFISMMKSSRRAEGVTTIYLPGEMEFATHLQRTEEGIPYPEVTIDQLRALARDLDIDIGF
jgi:LDH2 family malate/lactate/ureidoglycolate dehydrogenase